MDWLKTIELKLWIDECDRSARSLGQIAHTDRSAQTAEFSAKLASQREALKAGGKGSHHYSRARQHGI